MSSADRAANIAEELAQSAEAMRAADDTRGFVLPEADCRKEIDAARAFIAAVRGDLGV